MAVANTDLRSGAHIDLVPPDVAAAATGDRRAFERLYRSHVGRVYSICVRMCNNRVRAEELTQDIFIRVWQKLPLFRGESAFSTWLHRLAVNVVLNDRKVEGRSRARTVESDDENGRDQGASAHNDPPMEERLDLEAAIATLPRGARTIFVLHDVEGWKHEEIAELLGITSGGTKAQLHRARLLLRDVLKR